jgi:hypothetical protein
MLYLKRGSLFAPVYLRGTLPLEGVTEALRGHPRRSQRVLELYSLLALNLVRSPVSCA